MKQILSKLFILQSLISCALPIFIMATPYRAQWLSLVLGGIVATVPTLCIKILLRKLPIEKLTSKQFLIVVSGVEGLKWVLVGVFAVFFVQYRSVSALGIIIGFSVAYVGSYMVLLWEN